MMAKADNLPGKDGRLCLFAYSFLLFISFLSPKDASGGVRATSLQMEIFPQTRKIEATFTVKIGNSRGAPLEKQRFFLYPDMFDVDFLEGNFKDVIDGRSIKSGNLTMISAESGDGRAVTFKKDRGPYLSLFFVPPLESGQEVSVTLRYDVGLPNHFSCFSAVRDGMYLNGAFYPLPVSEGSGRPVLSLQAGEVAFEARVEKGNRDVLLIPHRDGYVKGDGTKGTASLLPDLRGAGLFLADFEEVSATAGGVTVTLFLENISGRQREKIEETIGQVSLFLRKRHPELLKDLERLLIIEAPLRKRVSFFTSYGVVVSDRIFDSVYLFQSQHQESLIESVLSYIASLRGKGEGFISKISAEFAGEMLTDEFREFTELELRNLRKILKPVTFIPVFDIIYYEGRMPFARSYIRTVYQFGFPGEDFPTTELRRVTGDSIYRVISSYDKVVPPAVLTEYLEGGDLIDILSKWGLDDDFLSLLGADPRSDYRVESVETRNGNHEINLMNEREDAPREGVKVLVALTDGTERDLVWDTKDRETTLSVNSSPGTKVKNVTVDPDLVMEDTDRSNNYLKRPLRVLLLSTNFSYEFNTGDFTGSALLNFKRVYDPVHSYFLRLATSDDSSSAEFFYRSAIRARPIGGLFWQGGLKYSHERDLTPSDENIVEGIFALDYSSLRFPFFPVRDIRGLASFSAGFFGREGTKQFYTLLARVVKYFQLDLRDTLALKLDSGIVWGNVPDVRLLDLGGKNRIRGIRSDDAEVENLVIGTVELRHLLTNDLDVGLPWGLLSLNGFAMNLFVDGGAGEFPPDAGEERKGFRASTGVGFFCIGNFLGIAEVNLNFEFARELDRFEDNSTLFYFKFNQSF